MIGLLGLKRRDWKKKFQEILALDFSQRASQLLQVTLWHVWHDKVSLARIKHDWITWPEKMILEEKILRNLGFKPQSKGLTASLSHPITCLAWEGFIGEKKTWQVAEMIWTIVKRASHRLERNPDFKIGVNEIDRRNASKSWLKTQSIWVEWCDVRESWL